MEENLEVFFCDICTTSVPARDLEIGAAARVKGKTIGGCCLAALGKDESPRGPSGSRGMAMSLAVLAAIAGATVFVDWRLTEEMATLGDGVAALQKDLDGQHQQLLGVEERLDSTALRDDVASLGDSLSVVAAGVGGDQEALSAAFEEFARTVSGLEQEIARLGSAQDRGQSVITRVERELGDLSRAVSELRTVPRGEPRVDPVPTGPDPRAAVDSSASLPPALQQQVGRLTDEDPATRFEAVDELLRSKNPRVLDSLLPMAKDPDAFVRRITVEGLSEFRHPDSVDTLLGALVDSEAIVRNTAYLALKKLTGEEFPFDPDASRDARLAAQRQWQQWWQGARETFSDH